ncbi:MAG: four helix bundle protein [Patescibacteria group bacterium]
MSYQNLLVWKESYQLTKAVYTLTSHFPDHERYGLVSQMRRSAFSISCNLAEGAGRFGANELNHFCSIALGSASELEVQLMLTKDLRLAPESSIDECVNKLQFVLRLLHGFRKKVHRPQTSVRKPRPSVIGP